MVSDAQLRARSNTARQVNHRRWHDGPLDDCPRCNDTPPQTTGPTP